MSDSINLIVCCGVSLRFYTNLEFFLFFVFLDCYDYVMFIIVYIFQFAPADASHWLTESSKVYTLATSLAYFYRGCEIFPQYARSNKPGIKTNG